jgi:hypothetical protein
MRSTLDLFIARIGALDRHRSIRLKNIVLISPTQWSRAIRATRWQSIEHARCSRLALHWRRCLARLTRWPLGEKLMQWKVGADSLKVPPGDSPDIIYEHLSPGLFVREVAGSSTLAFDVEADTGELSRWAAAAGGRQYRTFQLIPFETGKPAVSENQ